MFVRTIRVPSHRKLIGSAVVAGLIASTAALQLSTSIAAHADTAPAATSTTPATVTADPLPTVQINGVVWAEAVVGNTVYATGSFTSSRPAGSAAGVNETPTANLIAYNITTGARIMSFNHTLNAQGRSLAVSPDGSTLYVGGYFTTVDGVSHTRVAAFSTASGALLTKFAPKVDAAVQTMAATNSTLYIGGAFSTVVGKPRTRLAAVAAGTGALLPWAPTADATVTSMVLSPSGSRVIVGGAFANLNGATALGIGAIDPVLGLTLPWAPNFPIHDYGSSAGITSLTTDGTQVFGTGYQFTGGLGNFEGSFSINPETGALNWANDCHGDNYGAFAVGSVLYSVGHTHNCSAIGAFPNYFPSYEQAHRALAETTYPTTTNTGPDDYGYNYSGVPATTVLDWFPRLETGKFTGQTQAAWSVAGNSNYVVMGGEFPSVNGVAQQGLVRFAVHSIAPNKTGIVYNSVVAPTISARADGSTLVEWSTAWDRDNELLTYKLYRDGAKTPVYTTTAASTFWRTPTIDFIDTTVTAGTHSYLFKVSDPDGNTTTSTATTATIATAGTTSTSADLALNQPTSESSLGYGGVPSRAVDGNTDGVYGDNSVTHTGTDANSWWQVDLQAASTVGAITISNRTDCCTSRLSDYYVFASATPFDTRLTPAQQAALPGVWSSHQVSTPSPSVTLALPAGTSARYVMVQENTANTNLSLAEVQVFATAPVVTTTVNNTGAAFSYAGSWVESAGRGVGDYSDDVDASNVVGDTATFTWTGTSATIYGETNSDQGIDGINLDGVDQATVDTSSVNRVAQAPIYTVSGLSAGVHTVVITHLTGTWSTIDSAITA